MPTLRETISSIFTRGGGAKVPVVDAKQTPPTYRNVPRKWSTSTFGPGQPIATGALMEANARQQDGETEPRSFVYVPNVNATMSPRMAYGLIPFTTLRAFAETVPEVGQSLRILIEELKAFRPTISLPDDTELTPANREWVDLRWMTESPDRFNPWPVWLSRFLYNVLVYDAGSVYRERMPRLGVDKIVSLRVLDGSTLFVLVDEQGEQPRPPAPAFQQIIYGMPRGLFNTHQIWYRPRHLRADAPYGRSPIEDALPAVRLLSNLWDYEGSWYTDGTISEQVLTAPPDWTTDQILQFEADFNARMAGNPEERAGRARFVPSGTQSLSLKDARFREDVYAAASNVVRMAYGIPKTEAGESPGTGLGGAGFLEAMQSMFYRMGLAPLKSYVESLFNDTLKENGYPGFKFALNFPQDSIDPHKEEEKTTARYQAGIITRNEARRAIGLQEDPTPAGKEYGTNGNQQQGNGEQQGNLDPRFAGMEPEEQVAGAPSRVKVNQALNVRAPIRVIDPEGNQVGRVRVNQKLKIRQPLQVNPPLTVKKGVGVSPEEDTHFGAPFQVRGGIAYLGPQSLPAAWVPGQDACDEAVYLIDRALAPNDQRYLVPVTYHASAGGIDGLVTWPAAGKRGRKVSVYDPKHREQAAALDFIAGVVRDPEDYLSHPAEPDRPVLLATGLSFADAPSSPFVKAHAGQTLSQEMIESLQTIDQDEALWEDVSACAGKWAAEVARARARRLLEGGRIPADANQPQPEE